MPVTGIALLFLLGDMFLFDQVTEIKIFLPAYLLYILYNLLALFKRLILPENKFGLQHPLRFKKTVIRYTRPNGNLFVTDSKHVMHPTGELHVMNVDAHDGRSSYQCRTLHRLTGRTQESVTAGRIVIAGKSPVLSLQHVIRILGVQCFDQTLPGRRFQQFPLLP
jgi:hypothetical protein